MFSFWEPMPTPLRRRSPYHWTPSAYAMDPFSAFDRSIMDWEALMDHPRRMAMASPVMPSWYYPQYHQPRRRYQVYDPLAVNLVKLMPLWDDDEELAFMRDLPTRRNDQVQSQLQTQEQKQQESPKDDSTVSIAHPNAKSTNSKNKSKSKTQDSAKNSKTRIKPKTKKAFDTDKKKEVIIEPSAEPEADANTTSTPATAKPTKKTGGDPDSDTNTEVDTDNEVHHVDSEQPQDENPLASLPAFTTYSFSASTIFDENGQPIVSKKRHYQDSTGRIKTIHEREIDGKTMRTIWNRMDKDDVGHEQTICSTGSRDEFERLWSESPFGKAQLEDDKLQDEATAQEKTRTEENNEEQAEEQKESTAQDAQQKQLKCESDQVNASTVAEPKPVAAE